MRTTEPSGFLHSTGEAVLRAALRSLCLACAALALSGCNGGRRACRAKCNAECLGVQSYTEFGAEYCTCDTRAVVPGCKR